MRVRSVVLASLMATASPALAEPTPTALLDEAIAKVRDLSVNRDKVDWPALEAKVRGEAAGAKDVVDLLRPLELLVEGLGDGHSFINASAEDAAEYERRHGAAFTAGRKGRKPTSAFIGRRTPLVEQKGRLAVLTVPMMMGGGAKANAYAQTLFDGVAKGASSTCGYVVDLRGNGGGNVWPMLLGLSPLLGNPWNGYDLKRDGSRSTYATVWNGKTTIMDKADPNVGVTFQQIDGWKPLPGALMAPVAVLTDDAVGSSGEGVAVAFKGRPNTRSFGQATYGLASSNEGFMVADRINVVVTSGWMVDRFWRTYPEGLVPDQPVSAGDGDPVMAAATRWLEGQPDCA